MKQIIPIILLILTASLCEAQQTADTLKLSRTEAIRIGLQNRYDVKANAYDARIAGSQIAQAKNKWLPEINGDGQVRYSPQLQNSVIPGGVLPGFNEPTLLPLTVKNQTVLGLSLSQPIYDANLINDVRIAKNRSLQQQEKNRAAEIEIMLTISRSYLDVQLRGLQRRVAANIAERNSEYEKIAEGMLKAGSLIENQYLRAKLDRENAEQLLKQAEQSYALSLLQLHYHLNVPESTNLKLTDPLELTGASDPDASQPSGTRSEIRLLELAGQEYELNLRKARQALLPALSFGANYSQQFLSDDFRYGTGRWWSPFSYLSLNLHIPISAHYKNRALSSEYRERIGQNTMLLAQKKADIDYEVQQAKIALRNAVSNMKNAGDSYQLSKTIFQNQQQQYRLGAFEYSSLLDTEKSLNETERVYIQSAYDLMLARLQLQKATNNFNVNK
ncbi:TolC family protein [Mucilaginibacter sp. 21P]|uniref:TolC family protein n=1 Tax=Mucilaginibacter sp. 21P TaxID=2778902 RepID=UPI001C58F412|nr:TolC family protein [Mucilaginibacter sp. 21P]QXV63956.1 TolC family protein [Mucilaginibacter sp. 21P]